MLKVTTEFGVIILALSTPAIARDNLATALPAACKVSAMQARPTALRWACLFAVDLHHAQPSHGEAWAT